MPALPPPRDGRAEEAGSIRHQAPLRKGLALIPRLQGLPFGDMTNEQKTLVHKLMQTAANDSGYLKAIGIIWLESVLYELSNQRPMRVLNNYVIQIYGDPADEKTAWGCVWKAITSQST